MIAEAQVEKDRNMLVQDFHLGMSEPALSSSSPLNDGGVDAFGFLPTAAYALVLHRHN